MYIAMNHFRVHAERSEDFERAWRERETYLDGAAGFKQLLLLKGSLDGGIQHYASHSVWQDEASFRAWVNSDLTQYQRNVQTTIVPAGGGAVFDVKIDDPGLYPIVSHAFAHVDLGQVGLLRVGNPEGTMSH